jgi:hypothetical protein
VRNWPGLPNLGRSCFINAVVKSLAALPDLDPMLADQTADAPATALVRKHLRTTINFVRSGGAVVTPLEPNALAQMLGLVSAFSGHTALRHYAVRAQHVGGSEHLLLSHLLEVLGNPHAFSLAYSTKEMTPLVPGPAQYQDGGTFSLLVSLRPDLAGHDLSAIPSIGALWEWVCANPRDFGDGEDRYMLPITVPDTMQLQITHFPPHKAMAFSEDLTFPVYAVDPVNHADSVTGQVAMQAVSAIVGNPNHVWAMIHGDNGWYENNDQTPSRRVPTRDLDEQVSAHGTLIRETSLVFYQKR